MSADELRARQNALFVRAVARAWQIPFYQRLWGAAGSLGTNVQMAEAMTTLIDAPIPPMAGFSAHLSLSRKDYGLTWNALLEAGGVAVSDKIEIGLEIEAIAPAAIAAA